MQPASLLARPGIDKETRILIGIATATWRADWKLRSSCTSSRNSEYSRRPEASLSYFWRIARACAPSLPNPRSASAALSSVSSRSPDRS